MDASPLLLAARRLPQRLWTIGPCRLRSKENQAAPPAVGRLAAPRTDDGLIRAE